MQWHIEQATVAGASFEELIEAIEVGMEIILDDGDAEADEFFVLLG
jgi:hypothetical protein